MRMDRLAIIFTYYLLLIIPRVRAESRYEVWLSFPKFDFLRTVNYGEWYFVQVYRLVTPLTSCLRFHHSDAIS